jgi:hypothetical protein
MNADVAIKDGAIHIVWEDMASGTVMYRKGTFSTVVTGISRVPEDAVLTLSPVPANRVLQISLQRDLQEPCAISITDITGRVVLRREYSSSMRSISLPTSELVDGVYQLRLQVGDAVITRKFVVAH